LLRTRRAAKIFLYRARRFPRLEFHDALKAQQPGSPVTTRSGSWQKGSSPCYLRAWPGLPRPDGITRFA